ncbi:MAG: hypothetical protein COW02_05075 [Comamonadaceae bacterium CG12_big_fil_rev_8_21_14_0_65_59_15]|nr:MAG: hypothetical protein COW02_05075 [Comamonadaceae bacterium CG12_big_fil_rev_8_21_14_0_65_59_15]
MKPYIELPPVAQLAYAELFDASLNESLMFAASLDGSFGFKGIRGRSYCYFQYMDMLGARKQIYVGPDSERIRSFIDEYKSRASSNIGKLSASAIALGCEQMQFKHYRVIKSLSDHGFFRHGGVLVGTHAFLAICNMLGIKSEENIYTNDVDFAHAGKNVSIALPSNIKVETRSAIEALNMGVIPFRTISGKTGGGYIDPKDPSFKIDLLTAMTSDSDDPVYIESLSAFLQPLKFMEFSMEDTTQAVVFFNEKSVLVNIPKPERFAVHKLIVSAERESSQEVKSVKDVRQANVLCQYLIDIGGESLADACKEAADNGPGWRKRLTQGVLRLRNINEEAADFIQAAMSDQPAPPIP